MERIRRLGEYDEFTDSLPDKIPYRRCFDDTDRLDAYNNLLFGRRDIAEDEILRVRDPEVTDFEGQIHRLRDGMGVMNNLNVCELNFIHNMKQTM